MKNEILQLSYIVNNSWNILFWIYIAMIIIWFLSQILMVVCYKKYFPGNKNENS
jgi:hypothetical protein